MFAPSDKREAAEFTHDLRRIAQHAPASYEALLEVKKAVVLSALPWPGCLEEQPGWFRATVDWLTRRGMLEGPLRGGL